MSQTGNRLAKPPTEFKSRPKPSERTTRPPVAMWDRVRILFLLLAGFLLLVWSDMAASPSGTLSFREALRDNVQSRWWLLALAGLELVRQFHYFLQEQSPAYYRWCLNRTEGVSKRTGKMNPWTRFRLARVFKWVFILTIADLIFAAMIHEPPLTALFVAPARFLAALPLALQLAFGFFFVIIQFVGLYWFLSRGGIDTIMPDEIETRFTDVKGQDAALGQLQETLVFLEDPDTIEEKGGYVPGGILLWGPPGTGKTLMAQAIAGETGRPFVSVEPAAFIQMFMGIGPLKVKGLYRKLRRLAMRYGGVIVFFDEADSLGSRGATATGADPTSPWNIDPGCNGMAYLSDSGRHAVFQMNPPGGAMAGGSTEQIIMGGMGGGGGMGTLQALLSEMSGLAKPRGLVNRVRKLLGMKPKPPPKYRILHIFATNMPDALDQAMLRPGRVDRSYKVGYPQKEGRTATFRYYLAKVKNELADQEIDKLATITPYFSGAAIKDIVNEALVIAIREGREVVSYTDVIRAKQLKQHGLPDDHEYIERERHSVAVHEACHAVVMYRLRKHEIIDMATIERRGDVGGFVASIPPEDQFVEWRSEREIDVMTFLASLAGERLFFEGDHSTGVGGDMRGATAITTQMHAHYAMGDTIAARSITLGSLRPGTQPVETGEDRALFDSEFGKSVDAKLKELYERTMAILGQNRHEVLALAHALEVHKTLGGEDVAAVIDGHIGPNIDGRTYHDARFAQELESYHAAVIEAHREHSGVQGQIPIPIPPAPVDVLVASSPKATATARVTNRTQMQAGPTSPPRPDA